MHLCGFPETCQRDLKAADILKGINDLFGKVQERFVRNKDLVRSVKVFLRQRPPLLIRQDDVRRPGRAVVFDVA